jgi:hypothetical protein
MRYRLLLLVAPLALAGCLDFDEFLGGPDAQLGVLDGAVVTHDFAGAPDDLVVPPQPDDGAIVSVDGSAACVMGTTKSCYTGSNKNIGIGVCQAGTATCVNGLYGPCVGEILPSGEACNGEDDDCNGVVDDLPKLSCGVGACATRLPACFNGAPQVCVPLPPKQEVCNNGIDDDCNGLIDEAPCSCVVVSPLGSDQNGTGTAQSPFRTIGKAISVAGSNNFAKSVCVTSGVTCPSTANYDESIQMRSGVSVYGGYASGNGLGRLKGCVTQINDIDSVGVHFDQSIHDPTILDGFAIFGFQDQSTAAVTIEGSTGVQVSNCAIVGGGTLTSIGVEIHDSNMQPATPLITHDNIIGGSAPSSFGIHVVNSAPVIQSNCDSFDDGARCSTSGCSSINHYILGRAQQNTGTETYGIYLDGSPGTLIDQNGICATGGSSVSAGIAVVGAAKGTTIRGNFISGGGMAQTAVGVILNPCGGHAPWVFDNYSINAASALGNGRADGVRAVGDCHPVIDSNLTISGDGTQQQVTDGIFCAFDAQSQIASRCSIQHNVEIDGAASANTMTSVGVVCDDGACARIERNEGISAHLGKLAIGLSLGRTGVFVDSNVISAGCATGYAYGIATQDSFARIQNNKISGSACSQPSGTLVSSVGVAETMIDQKHEVDLHSNDVFAGGDMAMCTSAAVALAVGQNVQGFTGGIVRNNILEAGACNVRYGYLGATPGVQVRVVENNDFPGKPNALWHDQVGHDLQSIDLVNALGIPGTSIAANLNADPNLAVTGKLNQGSACIDHGTSNGAPSTDAFGNMRPRGFGYDIGFFEY